MTFCIYLSKCLFGVFPKKTLRGRKSVQRGLCLKITVVTDADKRQASRLSPSSPAGEDEAGPEEEWQGLQNTLFSGFCHHVTYCISFNICSYILYKPLTDLGHVTSSLENKNKDCGEIFESIL